MERATALKTRCYARAATGGSRAKVKLAYLRPSFLVYSFHTPIVRPSRPSSRSRLISERPESESMPASDERIAVTDESSFFFGSNFFVCEEAREARENGSENRREGDEAT